MANSILAVDMVSVVLVLTEGDIDITLEELFQRVTEYQSANQRIFGTSDTDFSTALTNLIFMHTHLAEFFNYNTVVSLKLREMIPEILKLNEVYMNDEGEEWLHTIDYDDDFLELYFKLNRKEYEQKIQTKMAMIEFFKHCNIKPADLTLIHDFMRQNDITRLILEDSSYLR